MTEGNSPERKNPFEAQPAEDGVRRIVERLEGGLEVNLYLVEGGEKALLIDTGFGSADPAAFVGRLTRLPLTVLNTHGHGDHSGGNARFPAVYAHPDDFDAVRRIAPGPDLLPAREGDVFDLGGRKLEVIDAPGHTAGSIVLLDPAGRRLFAGDTNNEVVWMFLAECLPLEAYLRSLEKLEARSGEFGAVLPGHGGALDRDFFREQLECTRNILGGKCRGEPYDSFAGSGMLCKHKRAGVAFDPGKLRLKP
jgi:hydroxyacylglutathione hydrolase